jgi:alpha-ribazole phosphatase
MAELWLVRHGQTDWNVEGRYQGQSDVPLNEAGLNQARLLAESLRGSHFDALYCSDLKRASRTAEILGQELGLPVIVDHRLREICQGEWEGLLVDEIARRFSASVSAWENRTREVRAPGGESVAEVAARVAQAADAIALAHPGQRILIVSHGLALATLICQSQGIPLAEVYSHIPDNAHPAVIQWPPELQTQAVRAQKSGPMLD